MAPTTAAKPCVSYLRVSTKRQGASGLGLEAQRAAVQEFVDRGHCTELVQEFVEVESGSKAARPELERALAACRLHGARLIVAKLDRLARNAAFLLSLRDAGVDFVAADMPEANRLTVGILAVVAEAEREAISKRTSEALQAAKERGVELGTPANLTDDHRRKGARVSADVRGARADQRAADLRPIIDEVRARGRTSLRQLAAGLNERGLRTPRGCEWTAGAVRRVLTRLEG
jgi:DNA invertase Pin-like site-specific DNA recombinase